MADRIAARLTQSNSGCEEKLVNRRKLLATTAASLAMGALRPARAATDAQATSVEGHSSELLPAPGDGLNPPGIRVAGIRMLPVAGGKYKVWTKKIGSGAVKVLLLHGGPGFSHEYLEAFESFLPQAGIEMYYYDQLGCNNSDQPDDPSLWTLARYTQEVEEVRRALVPEAGRLHQTAASARDARPPQPARSQARLRLPGIRADHYAFCPNGSHLCMWDDQEVYFRHLLGFLRAV